MMMIFLMTSTPVHTEEAEALPMDFLEFLGEGIVIEDEYLDPLNYDDIGQEGVAQRTGNRTTKSQTQEVTEDE